ncbi:GNAT family N-acetyltransferase [Promicromonospora sp. NPDC050262]|uniref:GNAT family N-acetyltransferase n=1 Tax=Promicromonospora sp. NPDC050262 TaxID=3155036 RepID=UPI003400E3AA
MTDSLDTRPVVVRRVEPDSPTAGLVALLTAYHLRTEEEKGVPVTDKAALPARYRAEIDDPRSAFADDVVLLAHSGDAAVGCLVVTTSADGRAELKRVWTDPGLRGRGVASRLVGAALDHAADAGLGTVALSVWRWRVGAIGLYERLGFTVVEPWDEREDLVCMERSVETWRDPGRRGASLSR